MSENSRRPPLPPPPPPPPPQSPLPEGWDERRDEAYGLYYFNERTGETQWERPTYKTLLDSGGFYTHTKNVWSAVPENLHTDASHWKRFIRSEASLNFNCIAMSRDKKQRKWYQQTRTHAVEVDSVIVDPSSSRSSPSLLTKEAIWHTDINGNVNNEYVEGAHILPAGDSDHVDWYNIGGAAVGLGVSASTKEKLRAVRGCKNMLTAQQKRHYHEGVLHLVSNRLYLKSQKQHIDGQRPKMLIVPIRSYDQVVGWKGEGYSAIVLVGEPETDVPLPEDLQVSDDKKKEVYRESRLNRETTADSQDVTQACNLLRDGVLALAEMIKSITDEDLLSISAENKKSAERLLSSRDKIGDTILVPGMVNETVPSNYKVLKITFSDHTDNEGHPAPDPLLLLFKAANVWGRMIGVHFLANGEIPDVFDTDKHIHAVENYLEWHQSNLKDVSREELALGLGQLSH
ncbi:MAG: hypothetical protein SGILL_006679 [Bacillariaceae sp.]